MRSWRSWTSWLQSVLRTGTDASQDATRDTNTEPGLSLRFGLFLTVTIALLPIAVVSVLQGLERGRIDDTNIHERLIESARAAATDEENVLSSGEDVLRAVSNFSEVRRMSPGCDRALSEALIGLRFFADLTRIDARGRVVCSAVPAAVGRSAVDWPLFRAAQNTVGFVISGQIHSEIVNRPVIAEMLALHDNSGKFAGAVALILDVRWLDYMLHAKDLPPEAVVAVFDRADTVMASNNPKLAPAIFAHASINASDQAKLESGVDPTGDNWSFATSPLIGRSIFVGFAMREAHLFGPSYIHVGTFLIPTLMIVAAWIAIWFATDRQVIQWIRYLTRVAAAYRRGHYAVRPVLDRAPGEFRALGYAMTEMADAIRDRDRRLREAIEQKTVLIREVHHRVKNNLQIVMSLLSLQAGQLRDPAARDALMQAQVRINALALVHRILHELEDQSRVDLKRLLEELSHQVTGGLSSEGDGLSVATDIVPREVSGDLAVPLALFTVEALTNIFKHAYPNGQGPGHVRVSLREVPGGKLRLAIEDDGIGFNTSQAGSGRRIGARLIETFGQQVGGTSSVHSNEGRGTTVELVFPDPHQEDEDERLASVAAE